MPIHFPSAPTLNTAISGDLFQIEATSPVSPSPAESLSGLGAYSHFAPLWSSPSERLTDTLPNPTKEHVPCASQSALECAVQTLQGNYRELKHSSRSELSHTRIAVERRMDELAEAMHSDMRRLRDDALSEAATNHSDVFRCATTLSHIQDRLSRLEIAFNSLQDALRSLHPAFANALSNSPTQAQQQPLNHSPVTHPTPIALAH